jgi:hypothetical protein
LLFIVKQTGNGRKRPFGSFYWEFPGIAVVIPIALHFFSGVGTKGGHGGNGSNFNPGILLLALLLIVVFVAIFSRKFKWDQYEQRYRELLARGESKRKMKNNW